jgi:formylmethanofuran dehydrogenase subunit E
MENNHDVCPKCNEEKELDALSRDNKHMICSDCAQQEAFDEFKLWIK